MITQHARHAGWEIRVSQPEGEVGGWTAEVIDPASGRMVEAFETANYNGRKAVLAAAEEYIDAAISRRAGPQRPG